MPLGKNGHLFGLFFCCFILGSWSSGLFLLTKSAAGFSVPQQRLSAWKDSRVLASRPVTRIQMAQGESFGCRNALSCPVPLWSLGLLVCMASAVLQFFQTDLKIQNSFCSCAGSVALLPAFCHLEAGDLLGCSCFVLVHSLHSRAGAEAPACPSVASKDKGFHVA